MSNANKKTRVQYVDRLRGLAVIGMFFVHSTYPWLYPAVRKSSYGIVLSHISGMIAPVFMFLAGISIAIIAHRHFESPPSVLAATKKKLIIRGIYIALVGYGLSGWFWILWSFYGDWLKVLKIDILQCIGISMAALVFLAWPKKNEILNTRALAAFFLFLFGAQLTWRIPLENWIPIPLSGYITHIPKMARFPLFPYAAWIALGVLVGPFWIRARQSSSQEKAFWIKLLVGVVVCYGGFVGLEKVHHLTGFGTLTWRDTPPYTNVHYFLFKMSVLLLLFFAARVSAPVIDKFPVAVASLFGKTSLFGYCVHLLLIYRVFGLFAKQNLTAPQHFGMVLLMFVTMFGLSYIWYKYPPDKGIIALYQRITQFRAKKLET